jgi:hypothetical protein
MAYKINPNEIYMGIAARSLYLIAKYIPLSDMEAQAILYHDGQYIDANKEVAHSESPLTLLAQFADLWTTRIYETNCVIQEDKAYYERKD